VSGPALLAGPELATGAEWLAQHQRRLGPLPPGDGRFLDVLERSGLRGRGGAAFPVARKWRSVAAQAGAPVVLVNGAEGEPYSRKDQLLMELRPHLVLDGAYTAARVTGADEVVLYIGAEHGAALAAMQRALAERSDAERRLTRTASAPVRYVSGEESAAVHFVNEGTALPVTVPPRPYERGIGGRPTLVQNVETLAHVALIARNGDAWYRSLGVDGSGGTLLVTLSGAVRDIAVREVCQGSTVGDAVVAAGGATSHVAGVLLGGYFGSWMHPDEAWATILDDASMRARGRSLGCGVIGLLPQDRCGVLATSGVMSYLAHESARQCGPCVFGLRAIAAATGRIAALGAARDDLRRIERWSAQLTGRGACHHPDGAATFLLSALRVFGTEFALHQHQRRCSVQRATAAA